MLKLLTCARGHFWESANSSESDVPACPECGTTADSLPLLDLEPSQITATLPPVIPPVEPELFAEDGRPIVAGFEITEDLGRASTGVRLYRARQALVNRDVLLAVVAAREDASQNAWDSLRGESSALGKLSHPNIIQIHDVGERDRQLFYNATELVDGPTLAQKVADKPLPFPQVMRLIELLARAVDHAHQKGVLHRNLRPTSVLLQPVEMPRDSPARDDPTGSVCQLHNGFFIPRLTGFGIVRRAVEGEAIDLDILGEDLGYLSPEQAWGRAKDLGRPTDVYGLGGILYFLLTGRPPFRGPTTNDILDAIQTAELVSPSSMRRVPADLEAICKKCLARQPRRRYASAAALADDLRRAQTGHALVGKPPSAAQRLGKAIGRHPAVILLSVLLVASLVGSILAYSAGVAQSDHSRHVTNEIRRQLSNNQTQIARMQMQVDRVRQLQEFLAHKQKIDRAERALAKGKNQDAQVILQGVPQERRAFEWSYLMARALGQGSTVLDKFQADLTAMTFGPRGGKHLATAEQGPVVGFNGQRKGLVRLWRGTAEVHKWTDLSGPVHDLAFNPDGTRLAIAGGDSNDSTGELRVVTIDFHIEGVPGRGDLVFSRLLGDTRLTSVAYSGDGLLLWAVQGNGLVNQLLAINGQASNQPMGQHVFGNPPITRASPNPQGTSFVVFTLGQSDARLYNTFAVASVRVLSGIGDIQAAAYGMNNRVALARSDASISIHEVSSSDDAVRLGDLGRTPIRLAFSPDGTRLAAAFPDDSVRVWALAGPAWVEVLSFEGVNAQAGLAFSSTGKALAAGGKRTVVVWGEAE